MEQKIIDNIYHLLRSRVVTGILYLVLVIVTALVVAGVVKFKIVKPVAQVLLVIGTVIGAIALLALQFNTVMPIYQDYSEQSYVVLDNAKLELKTDAIGTIDRINYVIVTDSSGKQYEFKIDFDYDLSKGATYIGTIAYLEHSNYVIWYCFDENTPIVSQ